MMKKNTIVLFVLTLFVQFALAQKDNYYLPYEMPGHVAVKYNSFLLNPAFPILAESKESHVALYHRNQWMNFKNNFKTFSGTYGKKWSDQEMFHLMAFNTKMGVFANTGILGNYIHQIEISDGNYLRLGVNAVFAMSGLSRGEIIVNDPTDRAYDNISTTGIVNVNPAFDMNFGTFHFGISAENLIDYAISSGEMAVPFGEKAFVGHVMYRNVMEGASGILEEATFAAMAKARKSPDNIQVGGHLLLDMPLLGWIFGGYDQKYGIFGGLGFNINTHFSAGFGYEQGLATYVKNLGGTYDVTLAYHFGGERHERAKKLAKDRKAKEVELEAKRQAAARAKEEANKKPEVVPPPTETKPTPPPVKEEQKTVMQRLEDRMRVQEHKIADEKIAGGFYVIGNVFRNPKGAYQYMQNIRAIGLTANSFVHPQNGMTYVYFEKPFDTKSEAGVLMMDLLKRPEFANKSIWVLRVSR